MFFVPHTFNYTTPAGNVYCSVEGKPVKAIRGYYVLDGKLHEIFDRGSGTASDPYMVYTQQDFWEIEQEPGACYALGCDIDLGGGGCRGICMSVPFTGTLDGRGHYLDPGGTMSWQDSEEGPLSALIGINKGTITRVGGVFNTLGPSSIASNPDETIYGGLVGINEGTISQCHVLYAGTTGTGNYGGAVAGLNRGTVENCMSQSQLRYRHGRFGGIVGRNEKVVSRCYCDVFWIPPNQGSSGEFEDFGLISYQTTSYLNCCCMYCRLTSGYLRSESISSDVGYSGDERISSCKNFKSLDEVRKQSNYLRWDFSSIWYLTSASSSPLLRVFRN